MKPVISVFETELKNKESICSQLQTLVKQKNVEGIIEYTPKQKKATEVIRILKENGILYEIRMEAEPSAK